MGDMNYQCATCGNPVYYVECGSCVEKDLTNKLSDENQQGGARMSGKDIGGAGGAPLGITPKFTETDRWVLASIRERYRSLITEVNAAMGDGDVRNAPTCSMCRRDKVGDELTWACDFHRGAWSVLNDIKESTPILTHREGYNDGIEQGLKMAKRHLTQEGVTVHYKPSANDYSNHLDTDEEVGELVDQGRVRRLIPMDEEVGDG